jgi:hypothetical protein
MSAAIDLLSPTGLSLEMAQRQVELLTGDPNTRMYVRLIHDQDRNRLAIKYFGTISDLWTDIERHQGQGFGVFIVVNKGGDADADIVEVRAAFIDADGVPLEGVRWHLRPDFIVQRNATHWHAYWICTDMPPAQFRDVQRWLANHYGGDPKVCNPSRVMRLAGTLHLKGDAK